MAQLEQIQSCHPPFVEDQVLSQVVSSFEKKISVLELAPLHAARRGAVLVDLAFWQRPGSFKSSDNIL